MAVVPSGFFLLLLVDKPVDNVENSQGCAILFAIIFHFYVNQCSVEHCYHFVISLTALSTAKPVQIPV